MLWRRCLLSTAALAVSAGVASLIAVMLSSTSETPPAETAVVLPSNDSGVTAGGTIRPVEVPRENDTDGSSSEERNEERDRGEGDKEACLPCRSLFGKLEQTKHGESVQEVQVQVRTRGEKRGMKGMKGIQGRREMRERRSQVEAMALWEGMRGW